LSSRTSSEASQRQTPARPGGEERKRERESEIAMVFLDVLVNYGCRRWLHKEDYTFE